MELFSAKFVAVAVLLTLGCAAQVRTVPLGKEKGALPTGAPPPELHWTGAQLSFAYQPVAVMRAEKKGAIRTPGEHALDGIMAKEAAALGADAVIDVSSSRWNPATPKSDWRWATGLAVRKVADGAPGSVAREDKVVVLVPIVNAERLQIDAKKAREYEEALRVSAHYHLAKKGYHVVTPISMPAGGAGATQAIDPETWATIFGPLPGKAMFVELGSVGGGNAGVASAHTAHLDLRLYTFGHATPTWETSSESTNLNLGLANVLTGGGKTKALTNAVKKLIESLDGPLMTPSDRVGGAPRDE